MSEGVGSIVSGGVERERSGQGAGEATAFRVRVCWVKAGHDVLHERAPFVLSLLHEVRPVWLGCCPRCVERGIAPALPRPGSDRIGSMIRAVEPGPLPQIKKEREP